MAPRRWRYAWGWPSAPSAPSTRSITFCTTTRPGIFFTESLLEAADRGVRVRLLIDDMDTAQYDAMMVALDRHPNFEIRLFNPFSRALKLVSSAFDFRRVNRRMHNKSMTFDNVVTIVGGRNIGDEYFAAREDSNYDDLDVLGAGPVARDVSENFDEFWNSRFAVPVAAIVRDKDKQLSYDEARRILKKSWQKRRARARMAPPCKVASPIASNAGISG
ncbi:phospholipase D-like domain-containing protein [Jhaorihella thermophila]